MVISLKINIQDVVFHFLTLKKSMIILILTRAYLGIIVEKHKIISRAVQKAAK